MNTYLDKTTLGESIASIYNLKAQNATIGNLTNITTGTIFSNATITNLTLINATGGTLTNSTLSNTYATNMTIANLYNTYITSGNIFLNSNNPQIYAKLAGQALQNYQFYNLNTGNIFHGYDCYYDGANFISSNTNVPFLQWKTNVMAFLTAPASSAGNVAGMNPVFTLTSGGNLTISGTLTAGSKPFDIQHPLKNDPKQRLIHNAIEAPRTSLIYTGNTTLINGSGEVNIDSECVISKDCKMTPGTFEALTTNPYLFLQNMSNFDKVKGYITNGNILISSENTNGNISVNWMVSAERKDQFIKQWNMTNSNGSLITEYIKEDTTEFFSPKDV